ncbi:hypothetical protein A8139_05540 [Marinomonas primoryensis]|uniref:Phage tail protein n=1 Tax=Marinomonas primoryensis TaxID=178399 RepID=A0A2Z4PR26_9GAMM|nr:phage protein [Marinomonas primoryensis]AWX99513.1 hypothetical protein A8139_05540 [Marinomonas primoryensis]
MRLTGKDFTLMIGDYQVRVESMNASITDNRKVVKENGIPVDYTNGDVECSGEIELNIKNFKLISAAAKSAGSWRELKPFDIGINGKVSGEEQSIELDKCLLRISDLINIDPNSNDQMKVKLPFDVTGPDFVTIDGTTYLSAHDIRDL